MFEATGIKEQYREVVIEEEEYDVSFIRRMYKNRVFKMIFTYQENDNESSYEIEREEYEKFDYNVIKSIVDRVVVAACDALVEGESIRGSWIIALRDYKDAIKRLLCLN